MPAVNTSPGGSVLCTLHVPDPPDAGSAGRLAPWSPHDDVPLVRAAQQGDRASFEALYRRHARAVRAVLLGRVGRDDADDLVQEAFLTAWRQVRTLRDPAAFSAWTLAIARHLRIDHVRRRRPEAALDAPELVGARRVTDGGGSSEQERAGERLDAERALAAVATLPEAYRETLLLRLVEGMTGPEIAARTGLTPDSVRVNLCRGLKRLRDVLGRAPARPVHPRHDEMRARGDGLATTPGAGGVVPWSVRGQ